MNVNLNLTWTLSQNTAKRSHTHPFQLLEVTGTLLVGLWGWGAEFAGSGGGYLSWLSESPERMKAKRLLLSPLLHQPLAFYLFPCQSPSYQVWTRQECCKEKLIKRQYNALKILSVM